MPSTVVVGLQWGDEGKGKIVDYFASSADLVVRFNGGNNAGHTVVVAGKKYKLHTIPCGVVSGKRVLVGAGVALDPKIVLGEIDELTKGGISPNLGIDYKAHIITPYHRLLDKLQDDSQGKKGAGSTKSGIAPVYSDKHARLGIRFEDLVDENLLKEKLSAAHGRAKKLVSGFYNSSELVEDCLSEYLSYGKKLKKYATDVSLEVNSALDSGKNVFFEAAQGALLDIDHGVYPFCTSSNVISGAVCTGVGVSPKKIGKIVGVVKAYTSRVGNGPFPTELLDKTGDAIREKGFEYGTTTGRPRRIGWLDLVAVKYACRINGIEELAITKLDTLGGFPKLKVCTAYECDGKKLENYPAQSSLLPKCKPIYEEFAGWGELVGKKKLSELDSNCKKYVDFISKHCGVKVSIFSIGPGREETIRV